MARKIGIKDIENLSVGAAILGTGSNTAFIRRNLDGTDFDNVPDTQFMVPDLGSKYPEPTSGANTGVYNNVRTLNKEDVEKSRSGIGIEATVTQGNNGTIPLEKMQFLEGVGPDVGFEILKNSNWSKKIEDIHSFYNGFWAKVLIKNKSKIKELGINHWGNYEKKLFIINSNGIIKYRHVGPITKIVYKKINLIIKENK